MHKTEAEEAAHLLQLHGIVATQQLEILPEISIEALKQLLRKQLLYLLERDFERLLQSLYRIDVPEHQFKKALLAEDPAGDIADLILQRELIKVKTRQWYASKQSNGILPND